MKITDIKTTPPLGQENRNWVLMKVFTDEGIVGLGEWTPKAPQNDLKKALIGQDPMVHYDYLLGMGRAGAGAEIADFVDCIRKGTPSPVPGEEALVTQRILNAIYQSAEDGAEVKVR